MPLEIQGPSHSICKLGYREHLVVFRRHSMSSPASHTLHKKFRCRQLRPQALDDVQAHYNLLYKLGSDTGASFETMRELLSAAFPPTQLYYLLRLVEFVNEPFRSKAKRHISVILTKRHLATPPSSANLLLPPAHATRWKQRLGIWLKQWVADHKQLFPSLFLPKIHVIETRSATLGDRIFNYRGWQQRRTPDTQFRCSCFDVSSQHLLFAHSHAVILSHFESVFSELNLDVMAASMKDQYYGSSDNYLPGYVRKFAGWHTDCDSRPRHASRTFRYFNKRSLMNITTISLLLRAGHPVTPADHFPSRAHVLCPALFSQLLHSTFCTGEVFVPCRQPAAAFRAHMLTTIPARIQRQYAWGLRLQAPLPTARILPKPSKDWMKARPINLFFRTWAAHL